MSDLIILLLLSMDSFFVGISYKLDGIKITLSKMLLISFISGLFITISLLLGHLFIHIKAFYFTLVGSLVLAGLGMMKIYGALKKKEVPDNQHFLAICVKETNADLDKSKDLSWRETLLLAIALSLDSLFAGVSLQALLPIYILGLLQIIINFIAIILGSVLAKHIRWKQKIMSILAGALLICLAIIRFFI